VTSAKAPAAGAWRLTRPLPPASGSGRRIVYAERSAHLWVVGADGTVLRDYKVTGRIDRPRAGTYHVWSKSETTSNPKEKLTFDLMVRFARGYTGAPIGFHTIPRTYSGHPIQSESQLGTPVGRGGCVRQSRIDATWLYSWVRVGDTVVVLR
jgi:lipoprotein-anchoring transpeptidase ErfK/SrfK